MVDLIGLGVVLLIPFAVLFGLSWSDSGSSRVHSTARDGAVSVVDKHGRPLS